jgi:hypothetical protein
MKSWLVAGLEKDQLFDQLKLLPSEAVILLPRKVFTADSVTLASEVGAVQSPLLA